ncbi:uncharacterized protein N7483_004973 [Penicillium malachiteum]|uniref:uncharacterized protein n=1 Tax=Penicillium malachiteum TaxID=1324776 RepID=UPI0025490994|nr:uncharacterized protein N7483_004973 [Penicillium malachiteum]KAJ5730465.1 hypothetical protein N7483_004973 [Penicillium malachiteum]
MKAVQILGDVSSPNIFTNYSMETPEVKDSEILIRVHAAGITGDEIIWPEPYASATRIPGHEISGIVSALGPNYDGPLSIDQEVLAFLHTDRGQAQADYVVCLPDEVAVKPTSISHAQAAALPIPLLTAWEAITDHAMVKPGMRVFITGASGAVGIMAVQLARKLAGAFVIALASPRNHEMLKGLGANEVLDYNVSGWEKSVVGVDVVFDTVGGEVLAKTWECVKDDGVIVTVGDPAPDWAFGRGQAPEAVQCPNVRYFHFIVSPNAKRMEDGSEMVAAESLTTLAVKRFPFNEAKAAWGYAQKRNRVEKVVIDFIEEN